MKFRKITKPSNLNIVFIAIPLLGILILRFLNFDGLYGQDSYEYLRYTKAIQSYLLGGEHPGTFFWPILYPCIAAFFGFIFGSATFGLQFLSSISLSIGCIYILKTIQLLYPKQQYPFLYVLVFGLFCPFFFKMGLIIMSDVTAAMWIAICFYYFFKSHKQQTSLVPVFLFATCALITRYASLMITFPVICYALYLAIQRKAIKQVIYAILLSSLVFIPFLVLQWNALFEATSNYFLKLWSPSYFFKSSYTTQDGFQSYPFPNGLYVLYVIFHPGFIFIGVPLLFVALKNYKKQIEFPQKILGICIALYLIFLAGIPFQNPRILGLIFSLVLVFLYPYFSILLKIHWIKKYALPFAGLAFALQLLFWMRTFSPIYKRTLLEKEIVSMVAPYQGKTLYSFDVDLSLQGRGMHFNYKNLYLERYTDFNTKDLVLFYPEKFEVQWKDKNPIKNWNYIKEHYQLKTLKEDVSGWKLYEIITEKEN
ncbi:ArnT family glycosyltransferase [Lacinutrix cladophorae]